MADVIELYERFARDYPDRAVELQRRCNELTEKYRPPRATRDLNSVEAARLIGVCDQRIFELYRDGRLGECINGKPRFSEQECLAYKQGNRRPGRRPKNF